MGPEALVRGSAPGWVLGKAIISLGAHIEQFGGPSPALVGRGRRNGVW